MTDNRKEAFDPGDAFDAMAESFRVQVATMALEASRAAVYRDLPGDQQLACFVAGVLTGLMGVTHAFVSHPDHREVVREKVRDFADVADEWAAAVMDASEVRDD